MQIEPILACKDDIDDKCRVSCERRMLHKKKVGVDITLVDMLIPN